VSGFIRNENPGSSNRKGGENLPGLKNKVSRTMTIITGLVVPKSTPNWYKLDG
jgi:hypothetical protein